MRSRERLIEVLRSVNVKTAWPRQRVNLFRDAIDFLQSDIKPDVGSYHHMMTVERVRNIHAGHPSPHIRSLAADALHYLEPRP